MTPDNIDTEALRALKQQPIERIRDAFARAHKIATGGRAHYMSIPADAERDADLILSDAIDELEALRNAAPALLALPAKVEAQRKEIERLRAKVTELGGTCEGWHRISSKVRDERDALKAEVERLRAALGEMLSIVRCDPAMDGSERPRGLHHNAAEVLARVRPVYFESAALRGESEGKP